MEYRAADIRLFPAGAGYYAAYVFGSRDTVLLDSTAVEVLRLCSELRTLDDHKETAGRALARNGAQRKLLCQVIDSLAQRGILVSAIHYCDLLRERDAESHAAQDITSIAVVTRDRPAMLYRCLDSYVKHSRDYGRKLGIVVADDSKIHECRQSNIAHVDKISEQYGCSSHYVGLEQKREIIRLLSRRGAASTEILEFMLLGAEGWDRTSGANTNCLLLATSGQAFIKPDDDTICRTFASPMLDLRLDITSAFSPFQADWFPTRDDAFTATSFLPVDLLGAVQALLGKTVAQCAGDFKPNVRSYEGCGIPAAESRIIGVMTGLVGDCALGSLEGRLLARGPTRERMVHTETKYRIARSSRETRQAADTSVVGPSEFCMAYCLSLDNRHVLPPFFPVGRDSDGIFGATISRCCDNLILGHVPYGIVHDPIVTNITQADRSAIMPGQFDLPLIIRLCLPLRVQAGGRDLDTSLRDIGETFRRLGGLSARDFYEVISLRRLAAYSQSCCTFEDHGARYGGKPSYWFDDIRRLVDTFRAVATRGELALSKTLASLSHSERWAMAQKILLRYGEGLLAWPSIVQCTRELVVSGELSWL